MSDEAPEKSGKVWFYVVGLFVGLPLLYVLSVGPLAVLAARGIIPVPAFHAFYEPIGLFLAATVGTDAPIEGYVMLCFRLTGTPAP